MANFKRRRPKNRRAGCLMCKPWKANGCASPRARDARLLEQADQEQRAVQSGLHPLRPPPNQSPPDPH